MKFELKEFQVNAVKDLYKTIRKAVRDYYNDPDDFPVACSLRAPTGAGKTIMSGAVIEGFLQGNDELEMLEDEKIAFLWVSDSPSLNRQTMIKFQEATEISSLILEEIGPEFTQYHSRLEPGHVYFLNRQLLSTGNILVRGGETPTFWKLLKDTINDPSVHLVMMLDEAHKGIGSTKTAKGADTIYGKLINGEDGKTAMPIVVGISATPKRFQAAMNRLKNRTNLPPIEIKPADVQASGLLKDKIILSVPTDGAAVDSLYTKAACNALNESTMLWAGWCAQNKVNPVVPLLVIQVPNKVDTATLQNICIQVSEYVDGLDNKSSFAHVFGEDESIQAGAYYIPKVEPEDVQRKTDIRILFAKEAISTGWDCPRAEVIYSMRTHKDSTYVGQLIGRMVRTPLARQVSVDKLNAVTCYLPQYDPKAVHDVVNYLTDENADDYGAVAADAESIIIDPINTEWDSRLDDETTYGQSKGVYKGVPLESPESLDPVPKTSETDVSSQRKIQPADVPTEEKTLPKEDSDYTYDPAESSVVKEDGAIQISLGDVDVDTFMPQNVREAFMSVCSRVRAHQNRVNWISGANTYVGLLARYGINTDEVNNMRKLLAQELFTAIHTYKDQFDSARNDLVHVSTTRIELQYLNTESIKTNLSTEDADKYAIENGRKKADRTFTPEVSNEYVRLAISDNPDITEINTDLAAASYVEDIVEMVEKLAKNRTQSLMKQYESKVAVCDENTRADFELQLNKFGIPHTVYLRTPTKDTQNKLFKPYAKHVVNNPDNHLAYFDFKEYEDYVISTEIARNSVRAWYRNPSHGHPEHTLSIIYRYGDSRHAFHPDFIVFDEVEGGIKPSIIDPHGAWLGEALDKLQGMCAHVEEFGHVYNRIWAVDKIDGKYLYLDMKDDSIRDFIVQRKAESAAECYKKFGKPFI